MIICLAQIKGYLNFVKKYQKKNPNYRFYFKSHPVNYFIFKKSKNFKDYKIKSNINFNSCISSNISNAVLDFLNSKLKIYVFNDPQQINLLEDLQKIIQT